MNTRDLRASVVRFINHRNNQLGVTAKIIPGRGHLTRDRPVWLVETTPGGISEQISEGIYTLVRRFNLMYLTGPPNGYKDAEAMCAAWEDKLKDNRWRMAGVMEDFVYPRPALSERAGEGAIGAGTYYLAVSGLNYLDESEESLASIPQAITVGANARIRLVIPRYPRGFNWFKKYNVYMGTSPTSMFKTAGSPYSAAMLITTVVDIDAVPGVGGSPPTQSLVKYRMIKIAPSTFNASAMLDPVNEPGLYLASIGFNAEVQVIPGETQAEPVEQVTVGMSVDGTDPDDQQIVIP